MISRLETAAGLQSVFKFGEFSANSYQLLFAQYNTHQVRLLYFF